MTITCFKLTKISHLQELIYVSLRDDLALLRMFDPERGQRGPRLTVSDKQRTVTKLVKLDTN